MVKGRGEFEWARTSMVLATYINANRGKHGRPVKPEDLNPYADSKPAKEEKIQLNASETVAVLRKVFLNA